jgi:hypothetical protein
VEEFVTIMLEQGHVVEIIETAATHGLHIEGEAGGMDDVNCDIQAGSKPEEGSGVLRDVRLVEGEIDSNLQLSCTFEDKGGNSVLELGSVCPADWTSSKESAKRAPNRAPLRAGAGYCCLCSDVIRPRCGIWL